MSWIAGILVIIIAIFIIMRLRAVDRHDDDNPNGPYDGDGW